MRPRGVPASIPLDAVLRRSRNIGHEALRRSQPGYYDVSDVLRDHARAINSHTLTLPRTSSATDSMASLAESLAADIRGALLEVCDEFSGGLASAWKRISDVDSELTVALFGRTKAGKSTLMEALTHGDGAAIGAGAQNKTVDVKCYAWPPEQPMLHVVDTPGIEGFEGEALAAMAEQYVQGAHMLLYVLSDDAVGAEVVTQFARIHRLGKPLVVLLNLKSMPDRLLNRPELVFRDTTIAEHIERIRGALTEAGCDAGVEVIPIHAHAAYLSTKPDTPDAIRLRDLSRICLVERRIERFVREESVGSRLRSPRAPLRDLLDRTSRRLVGIRNEIASAITQAATLRSQLCNTLPQTAASLRESIDVALSPFITLDEGIEDLVNRVFEEGGNGEELARRWKEHVERADLPGIARRFEDEARVRFEQALEAELRTNGMLVHVDHADTIHGSLVGDAKARHDAWISKRWFKVMAAAPVSLGNALDSPALIAAVAAGGPAAIAAAVAAAAVLAVSTLIQIGINRKIEQRRVSNSTEAAYSQKTVTDELQKRLQRDRETLARAFADWIDCAMESLKCDVIEPVAATERWLGRIAAEVDAMVVALSAKDVTVFEDLVRHACEALVPEVSDGTVTIVHARQCASGMTLVTARTRPGGPPRAAPFLEGLRGERRIAIRDLIGSRDFRVIEDVWPIERKVEQCLAPLRCVITVSTGTDGMRHALVTSTAQFDTAEREVFDARLAIARTFAGPDGVSSPE